MNFPQRRFISPNIISYNFPFKTVIQNQPFFVGYEEWNSLYAIVDSRSTPVSRSTVTNKSKTTAGQKLHIFFFCSIGSVVVCTISETNKQHRKQATIKSLRPKPNYTLAEREQERRWVRSNNVNCLGYEKDTNETKYEVSLFFNMVKARQNVTVIVQFVVGLSLYFVFIVVVLCVLVESCALLFMVPTVQCKRRINKIAIMTHMSFCLLQASLVLPRWRKKRGREREGWKEKKNNNKMTTWYQ